MLTSFDKAMIPIIAGGLAWLNQKYGYHFDTSPETITVVVSALASILVYLAPNKEAKS